MVNILVVEDNSDLRELFCYTLNDNGFRAVGASDGEKALEFLAVNTVDLIVADIMMPNMNGYELAKALRRYDSNIPILIITAKDDYESMQKAFGFGVDDYMIKPVNIKEMLLRINALLRRAKIHSAKRVEIGATVLDSESMRATYKGVELTLPLKEFNLLFKLLSYIGKIFTRQQLMDEIWGMESDTDDKTINTHINRLRERFADNDDFEIVTIRGLGYKAEKK